MIEVLGQPVPVGLRHLATEEHRRAIDEGNLRAAPLLEPELPPRLGAGTPVRIAEPLVGTRGGAFLVLEAIHGGRLATPAAPQRRRRVLPKEAGDEGGLMAPRVAVAPGGVAVAEVVPLFLKPAARGHNRVAPLLPLELQNEAFPVRICGRRRGIRG